MIDFTDLEPRESDGSHLKPEQATAIEVYAARILAALDLSHWRVWVAKELPPDGCRLMIEPTDGRRIAMLYISEDWWGSNPGQKRTDITHECLHLAHHDTDEHVRRFFTESGDVSDYVKHVFLSSFKVNLERMVDSLSYVLAPYMPGWTD